jgi:uncharacterized membrane protein
MADKVTEDKFGDAMRPFGGQLLKTSLSEEDGKELADDLSGGHWTTSLVSALMKADATVTSASP